MSINQSRTSESEAAKSKAGSNVLIERFNHIAHVREDLSVHALREYYGLALSFGSSGATLPLFINRWRQEIRHDARTGLFRTCLS